ncbi:MAG: type III pantothenate kinase [Acidimicrobiia bacterium]
MLLAIDVGNTETVVGLFEGEELVAHWRLATVRERTYDEYRVFFEHLLRVDGFGTADISGASISSVVPTATTAVRRLAVAMVGGPTVVVEPGIRTGMGILIDNPREVGADRVANSIAALTRYGAPAIVVDFGTSTNFDVVNSDGNYVGGSIAPGLEVSLEALIAATAALRKVELEPPRSVVGKGTVEAIQSGLLYGHAALVDGMVDRISAELEAEPAVVATGGLASTIVPHCRLVDTVDEFLTLEGLRLVYERNIEGGG